MTKYYLWRNKKGDVCPWEKNKFWEVLLFARPHQKFLGNRKKVRRKERDICHLFLAVKEL